MCKKKYKKNGKNKIILRKILVVSSFIFSFVLLSPYLVFAKGEAVIDYDNNNEAFVLQVEDAIKKCQEQISEIKITDDGMFYLKSEPYPYQTYLRIWNNLFFLRELARNIGSDNIYIEGPSGQYFTPNEKKLFIQMFENIDVFIKSLDKSVLPILAKQKLISNLNIGSHLKADPIKVSFVAFNEVNHIQGGQKEDFFLKERIIDMLLRIKKIVGLNLSDSGGGSYQKDGLEGSQAKNILSLLVEQSNYGRHSRRVRINIKPELVLYNNPKLVEVPIITVDDNAAGVMKKQIFLKKSEGKGISTGSEVLAGGQSQYVDLTLYKDKTEETIDPLLMKLIRHIASFRKTINDSLLFDDDREKFYLKVYRDFLGGLFFFLDYVGNSSESRAFSLTSIAGTFYEDEKSDFMRKNVFFVPPEIIKKNELFIKIPVNSLSEKVIEILFPKGVKFINKNNPLIFHKSDVDGKGSVKTISEVKGILFKLSSYFSLLELDKNVNRKESIAAASANIWKSSIEALEIVPFAGFGYSHREVKYIKPSLLLFSELRRNPENGFVIKMTGTDTGTDIRKDIRKGADKISELERNLIEIMSKEFLPYFFREQQRTLSFISKRKHFFEVSYSYRNAIKGEVFSLQFLPFNAITSDDGILAQKKYISKAEEFFWNHDMSQEELEKLVSHLNKLLSYEILKAISIDKLTIDDFAGGEKKEISVGLLIKLSEILYVRKGAEDDRVISKKLSKPYEYISENFATYGEGWLFSYSDYSSSSRRGEQPVEKIKEVSDLDEFIKDKFFVFVNKDDKVFLFQQSIGKSERQMALVYVGSVDDLSKEDSISLTIRQRRINAGDKDSSKADSQRDFSVLVEKALSSGERISLMNCILLL